MAPRVAHDVPARRGHNPPGAKEILKKTFVPCLAKRGVVGGTVEGAWWPLTLVGSAILSPVPFLAAYSALRTAPPALAAGD